MSIVFIGIYICIGWLLNWVLKFSCWLFIVNCVIVDGLMFKMIWLFWINCVGICIVGKLVFIIKCGVYWLLII